MNDTMVTVLYYNPAASSEMYVPYTCNLFWDKYKLDIKKNICCNIQ